MNYNEFLHEAKDRLGVDSNEQAVTIARAFLHTLTEHMAGNAADKLAAQLPAELAHLIREISPEDRDQGERFKLTEFYLRVGKRAGVDDAMGRAYTHGFMDIFSRMVTEGELRKIEKTLSSDYAELFKSTHDSSETA